MYNIPKLKKSQRKNPERIAEKTAAAKISYSRHVHVYDRTSFNVLFLSPLKKTSPIWRRKSKNLRLNKRHNKNFVQFFKNASRKLLHPPLPFQPSSPISSTFNIWSPSCSWNPSSGRMYQKFVLTNVKTLPLLTRSSYIYTSTNILRFLRLIFFIFTSIT